MENSSSEGFTLFELIVVLVIVAIISSLTIPRMFNAITHVELKSAARRTVVFLNNVREEAYYKRKNTWILFDSDNKKMAAFKEDPSQQGELKVITSLEYDFPEGINIRLDNDPNQTDADRLLFSSIGSSSGGAVIVRDQHKRTYRIEVDIVTGFAQIAN